MVARRSHKRTVDDGFDSFAATEVDLMTPDGLNYTRSVINSTRRTARRAWDWYTKIGEVSFAVSRNARLAGYADLGAYVLDKDGVPSKRAGGLPDEVAASIYSRFGGQRAFTERFFTHIKVPGDTWLIRTRDDAGNEDGYDWCSASEIDISELEGARKTAGNGASPRQVIKRKMLAGRDGATLTTDIELNDFIGRVWRPSGEYVHVPDSPMYALDDVCEILVLLTKGLKVKLRQRMFMTPMLYVPSEVNKVRTSAPKVAGEKLHQNETIDQLLKAAMFQAANDEDPKTAVPTYLVGPGDQAQNVRYVEPDRTILETEIRLRAELIERLLFGLDINPEGVKGTSDANHWGAWAASDDEQRVAIKPDLETECWALTRLILWPAMAAAGLPPGRIRKTVIWYDLSRAIAKSNAAEDARQTFDRGQLSPEALRRHAGIPEGDKPSLLEQINAFGWETGDPYLAFFGTAVGSKDKEIDLTKTGSARTGPKADSNGTKPAAQPGKGDPGSPNDKTTNKKTQ